MASSGSTGGRGIETLDVVTAGMAAIVAVTATVYVWLPRTDRLEWLRMINEVALELSLLVLLGFAVTSFSDDTVNQRRRIKAAVAIMYTTAVYSIVAFGVVVFLSIKRGRDDVWVRHVSRRASKSSWVFFLIASLGLFVAFLTIPSSDARDDAKTYALVLGLVYPSLIAVVVLLVHLFFFVVNCVRPTRKSFSWQDTSGYHPMVHKVLTTVFAAFTVIFPISLAVSGGVDTVSDETTSARDTVTFLVDILAAMLHRYNLQEFTEERIQRDKELIASDEAAAQKAADAPRPPPPVVTHNVDRGFTPSATVPSPHPAFAQPTQQPLLQQPLPGLAAPVEAQAPHQPDQPLHGGDHAEQAAHGHQPHFLQAEHTPVPQTQPVDPRYGVPAQPGQAPAAAAWAPPPPYQSQGGPPCPVIPPRAHL